MSMTDKDRAAVERELRRAAVSDLFSDQNLNPPAQRHSATSRAAAKSIKPYVKPIRARVLECVIRHGPISDQGIATALGLAENTVRPRRAELMSEGWVRAAPESVLTRSRRQATAWVAAEPFSD